MWAFGLHVGGMGSNDVLVGACLFDNSAKFVQESNLKRPARISKDDQVAQAHRGVKHGWDPIAQMRL